MVMALFHSAITSIEYDRWRIHLNEWRNKIANDIEYHKQKKINEAIEICETFNRDAVETIPRYECFNEGTGDCISELGLEEAFNGYLPDWIREMYEYVEEQKEKKKICISTKIHIIFVDIYAETEEVHTIQDYAENGDCDCCCEYCISNAEYLREILRGE